ASTTRQPRLQTAHLPNSTEQRGGFTQLAACDARQLTEQAAALLGSTCWRNSPQARAAMSGAIAAAQAHLLKHSAKTP
ncbi:hypothetical protein CJ027_020730, partial [Xanthomonas sontii]|nr:hypothetical protein [Xanthomonas sontii]